MSHGAAHISRAKSGERSFSGFEVHDGSVHTVLCTSSSLVAFVPHLRATANALNYKCIQNLFRVFNAVKEPCAGALTLSNISSFRNIHRGRCAS